MSDRNPGAVIIGTGFGVVTHVRALRAAGFDVLALVGRDSQKTAERAAIANIPLALTSLPEALALPGVDAVAIATPPHSHAEICLQAIEAGKHVVCEKPFSADALEAQSMLDAAQDRGVVHYLGTEHRWDTGQALLTQSIRNGDIGVPRMVTQILQVPLLHEAEAEVPLWWGDVEQGGGWLGAYASHQIDFMIDLFGEFAGVSASLAVLSEHDWTADDSFSLHFRTHSGVDGIMQSSIGAIGPPLIHFRIAGSNGTLEMSGDRVWLYDKSGKKELLPPQELLNETPEPADSALMVTAYDKLHANGSDLSPYTKLYRSFRADIFGEAHPTSVRPATFREGMAMQQVLDAVRQSASERRWVDIGSKSD
jgi:predicted dehydrogenase